MSESYRDENCIEHMIEAMRNFVIHDYAGVDPDVIWDSTQTDIPQLLAALQELTTEESKK